MAWKELSETSDKCLGVCACVCMCVFERQRELGIGTEQPQKRQQVNKGMYQQVKRNRFTQYILSLTHTHTSTILTQGRVKVCMYMSDNPFPSPTLVVCFLTLLTPNSLYTNWHYMLTKQTMRENEEI